LASHGRGSRGRPIPPGVVDPVPAAEPTTSLRSLLHRRGVRCCDGRGGRLGGPQGGPKRVRERGARCAVAGLMLTALARLAAARCVNTDIGNTLLFWLWDGCDANEPALGREPPHHNVGPMAPLKTTHRLATLDDANRLFELRRHSIGALAVSAMSKAKANSWAASLTRAGMQQKLRDLEVWVAETGGAIAGWGAIRGDRLEGLYTDPRFASRGIGADLLRLLEAFARERGFSVMHAEASANALQFYLRRGYELNGPQTPDGAQPLQKRLRSSDP
jgi:putative acetyltransferase